MEGVEPERLVMIDECGVNLAMTRAYGRSASGVRLEESVPCNKGKNVTVVAAGRLSGVEASMSFERSQTIALFELFVEVILLPTLNPGDVVVCDNLRAHVQSDAEHLIESVGAELVFLPAYSPDFNPIVQCWSKIKASVRKAKARTSTALDAALTSAFKTVSCSYLRGWFQHCGYSLSPI
jgi:transposase